VARAAVARWRMVGILRGRRPGDDGHAGEALALLVAVRAVGRDSRVLHRCARTELGRRGVTGHAVTRRRDVSIALRHRCHPKERRPRRTDRVARRAAATDTRVDHRPGLVRRR